MNEILISHSVRDTSEEIDDMVAEGISYFEGIYLRLAMVDSRIDKIQPKIKQFFASLNRDIFNSKVDEFLYSLLEKSRVVGKQIEFPIPYVATIQIADSIRLLLLWIDRRLFFHRLVNSVRSTKKMRKRNRRPTGKAMCK